MQGMQRDWWGSRPVHDDTGWKNDTSENFGDTIIPALGIPNKETLSKMNNKILLQICHNAKEKEHFVEHPLTLSRTHALCTWNEVKERANKNDVSKVATREVVASIKAFQTFGMSICFRSQFCIFSHSHRGG